MGKNIIIAVIALVLANTAAASQVGFAFGSAAGDGDLTGNGFSAIDAEFGSVHANFTFNGCESCKVFNYRLHVGYFAGEIDYGNEVFDDYGGFEFSNSFGFKILNKDRFKLWLGPSIYVGVVGLDGDVSDEDGGGFIGLGPTLGLDFSMKNGSTIGLEFSIRGISADIDGDFIDEYDLGDFSAQVNFLF